MPVGTGRARTALTRTLTFTVAVALTALLPVPPAAAAAPEEHAATRAAMERAVSGGAPGVLVSVVDGTNRWVSTAGVADRRTRRPPRAADHFRVGSITKSFTATVVLQLAAEGRLSLDDTVETWLPGVVSGNGNDGRRITVRQLLNHTSGLYNHLNDPALHHVGPTWLDHLHDTWTTTEMVAVAMSQQPPAEPGEAWVYSNTNYLLAAMIVERVTGNPYERELRQRVIEPLGLRDTVAPGTRETLPPPSAHAYTTEQVRLPPPGVDVTEFNPSALRASGDLVSTVDDLHRFYRALLGGELLPEAQLRDMTTTVSVGTDGTDGTDSTDGTDQHALGLTRFTTSCGTTVWGQRGAGFGFEALAVTTRDTRHQLIMYINADALALAGEAFRDVVDAEFCGGAA